MTYTLITPSGTIRQFYLLAVAQLYQARLGGTIISPDILSEISSEKTRA